MFSCCWQVLSSAVVLIIYGFVFVGQNETINFSDRMSLINFKNFFEIAGIACYSIEGIGLLFALRYDYLKYNSFGQFRRVYFLILMFTVLIYFLFTIANFLKFYDTTGQIIFYNYSYHDTFPFVLAICYLIVSWKVTFLFKPTWNLRCFQLDLQIKICCWFFTWRRDFMRKRRTIGWS